MRFKHRRSHNDLPDVNLVPMMDVLMVVLTFFIIVSMSLTGQQIPNILLPQSEQAGQEAGTAETALTIGLNSSQQIILDGKTIDQTQLAEAMQKFYAKNPSGTITLKADRSLQYSHVAKLLKTMRDIGGDRVTLAIDHK